MSYYGYADFDRPIPFEEAGRIYYSYGGGPFVLTPNRCAVANSDDGQVNFSLDIYRPALSLPGTSGYAVLEMRLNARYDQDKALNFLRKQEPKAVLSLGVLTNWQFRLAPAPTGLSLPAELVTPAQLASNNLGSARLVTTLSQESGQILQSLLKDNVQPVFAIAEADMPGISPRVKAVVRFRAQELLPEIAALASKDGIISWQALVSYFNENAADLPAEITGQADLGQGTAFGEAMADRIVARFGSYVSSDDPANASFRFQEADIQSTTDLIWSLSQPFLATRRVVMRFDVLSDIRQQMQRLGSDAFIKQHTASSLPSLEPSHFMVFCNLPLQRVGVAALGANITFPPHLPGRPQGKTITVSLEPPDDLVQTQVQLAPGETLQYNYSTFAVISDDRGVSEVQGPPLSGSGSPLRLSPDTFPIDFAMLEATAELLRLASVSGVCRYTFGGREYSIPFTLSSECLAASLALPKGSEAANVTCLATERLSGRQLQLRPFEAWPVFLDLSSFPEYGYHEVEINCEFDGIALYYAIEIMTAGLPETFDNITTLVFTPAQPNRKFGWFAASPFQPGFRYRPQAADGANPGVWQEVPALVDNLTVRPQPPETRQVKEAFALSESVAYRPGKNGDGRTAEAALLNLNFAPNLVPILMKLPAPGTEPAVPLSPTTEPTDTQFYSLASDPKAKLYIPQYALDTQVASGQQRYRIAMTEQNQVSSLTVNLVKSPPDALKEAVREAGAAAREYPHSLSIFLDFLQLPPSGARKTLEFQDVTSQDSLVTAKLTFATLQERDEVFRALTETGRDARLTVKRLIDVALPQPTPSKPGIYNFNNLKFYPNNFLRIPDPPVYTLPATTLNINSLPPERLNSSILKSYARLTEASRLLTNVGSARDLLATNLVTKYPPIFTPSLPVPVLAFTGKEKKTVRDQDFWELSLSVTNWQDYAADFFQPAPDLAPCGNNTNASRTWLDIYDAGTNQRLYGFCALGSPGDLTKLWFAVPAGNPLPEQVYIQMEDRRLRVVRKSNTVDTHDPEQTTTQYQVVSRELDQAVAPVPFSFPYNLYSYIFQGIVPGSGANSGLVRYRLQGGPSSSGGPGTFHTYLQDTANPKLVYFFPDSFKIARKTEPPFLPFVTVRVASQTGTQDTDVTFDYFIAPYTDPARLNNARNALLADPRFGATEVQFQPFITNEVRFFLDRPTERGAVHEERSGMSLVLQGPVKDTLVMKLPDFRVLFDALQRDTASLFLGRVEIEVPGEDTEIIPFTGRMDDLAGELFLYGAVGNGDGSTGVSLLNAIESPVQINALDVLFSMNGQNVPAVTQGLALPVDNLAPGERVDFKVVPQTAIGSAGTPQVQFSLRDVRVKPDAAAIWSAILDTTTLAYFNMITVKALPTLFTPVAGRENDQIMVILVEFQGGGTAELTAAQPERQVRIDFPIDKVILHQPVDESYSYTVTVIRADGRQERDAAPRVQSASLFYVSVVK